MSNPRIVAIGAGSDAFPLLHQRIAEKGPAYWVPHNDKARWGTLWRKIIDLYRIHGVLAIGDTAHRSANDWPWWYSATEGELLRWDEQPLRKSWQGLLTILAKEQQARLQLAPIPRARSPLQ